MKKRTMMLTMAIIFTTSVLVGCKKETNVTVKEDVKEESSIKDKEKELYENLGELPIDNREGYLTIGWKDEENTILLDFTQKNNYKTEIYNYNLKSKANTKVAELGRIESPERSCVGKDKIAYILDKKVWIYDIHNNSKTSIYNLDKVENDLKKQKYYKDEDINLVRVLPIRGSDKYVSISEHLQFDGYHEDMIRIVDIDTGTEYTTEYYKDLNIGGELLYSKKKDMFYVGSPTERVYQFNPIRGKELNEIIKISGLDRYGWDVSGDGNNIYLMASDKDDNYIAELDLNNNKANRIFENKKYKNDINGNRIRSFYIKDNIINYNLNNSFEENEWIKSYDESFIGEMLNKEIINVDKLNYVNKDNIPNSNHIQFNNDGSKLIKRVLLQRDKDFKDVEYKYFLYERKK